MGTHQKVCPSVFVIHNKLARGKPEKREGSTFETLDPVLCWLREPVPRKEPKCRRALVCRDNGERVGRPKSVSHEHTPLGHPSREGTGELGAGDLRAILGLFYAPDNVAARLRTAERTPQEWQLQTLTLSLGA